MTGLPGLKVCEACAIGKRKCGKQKPCCSRCKRRGIQCIYPRSKPGSFVPYEGESILSIRHDFVPYTTWRPSLYTLDTPPVEAEIVHHISPLGPDPGLAEYQLASSWFASPDTWKISHFREAEVNEYSAHDLNCHISRVRRWLTQWVEDGSNPFIHQRLYRTRFPRSVQDAYAILSCYTHKTPRNECAVFQILEDKARQLISENSSVSDSLDLLEQLARVQALLIYQTIGLYDGNIRLRHLAESHIPVLNSWLYQLVERASQETYLGLSMVSTSHDRSEFGFSISELIHLENHLWYSWILAETIRRTWVVISGIQGIYVGIQLGRSGDACIGGMMLTTRKGVWEAKSSPEWEKVCSEVNAGLFHLADFESLFTEAEPGNINDFTIAMLEAIFGPERIQRWGVSIEE